MKTRGERHPSVAPARIFQTGSADFRVCCIAGFQTRRRHAMATPCRFGNRRYSRFGNLRYAAGRVASGIWARRESQ
jgi:hypothetical protein